MFLQIIGNPLRNQMRPGKTLVHPVSNLRGRNRIRTHGQQFYPIRIMQNFSVISFHLFVFARFPRCRHDRRELRISSYRTHLANDSSISPPMIQKKRIIGLLRMEFPQRSVSITRRRQFHLQIAYLKQRIFLSRQPAKRQPVFVGKKLFRLFYAAESP